MSEAERAYAAIHRSLVQMPGEAEVLDEDGARVLRFAASAPCPVTVADEAGEHEGSLLAFRWSDAGDARGENPLALILEGVTVSDDPVEQALAGRTALVFEADAPCPVEVGVSGDARTGRLRAFRWYV